MRRINLIVSCAENRAIGRGGRMPWSIPEDRDFFHAKTAGQIVIMGRICFETWPQAVTDGRRPVVVTTRGVKASVPSAPSLPDALSIAAGLPGDVYICGGQRIYDEAIGMPQASRLYLTLVHAEVPGDVFFPDWRAVFNREVERREGADSNWNYTFLTLEK